MSYFRGHTSLVFVCLAVALLLVAIPLGAAVGFLTALSFLTPASRSIIVRRVASRRDEQLTSLLSVVPSRAPPASFASA